MEYTIKQLTILGSTGSIGVNALRVVEQHNDKFDLIGLSAHSNVDRLIEQALKYEPKAVCIVDTSKVKRLKDGLSSLNIDIYTGRDGLLELSGRNDANFLLNAIVGSPGMEPTVHAIQSSVDVALSNKESLVMAGEVINNLLEEHGTNLYPVDSEHSAIWQCLQGENAGDVKKIILTGSGGPFRDTALADLKHVTKAQALDHPNWDMGNKITIDSATMANKGLEVIEAHWLFNVAISQIQVIIHPQSIIHSMVEFKDGSIKAQMGVPDMKVPIQYALLYPKHSETDWEKLDFEELSALTFEKPDFNKFRCMKLAFESLETGGTMPAVLNIANELAVYAFLNDEIRFHQIPDVIESALDAHSPIMHPHLEEILETERWTKEYLKPKLGSRI